MKKKNCGNFEFLSYLENRMFEKNTLLTKIHNYFRESNWIPVRSKEMFYAR